MTLPMSNARNSGDQLDLIAREIVSEWYQRAKRNYVTEEESQALGVGPEIKCFHRRGNHRIKFARARELDVTYALGAHSREGRLFIESSVNNKSDGFDYELFVDRLKNYYWQSRNEKPWTDPDFDHFTYGDLLLFEPRMGKSVILDARQDRADIIRLFFEINPRHEELLRSRPDIFRDLIEEYCIAPLKRIYAESYREG